MFKPELLLPAGNIDTFYAALEGGADAVYLGLKKFNARNRAKNFTEQDISNIVKEAHKRQKKIYITLNTLIKNKEIPDLLNSLYFLSQIKPDAVIVQDFASIKLIQSYFKDLEIHASTQMSCHNSLSTKILKDAGVKRIILSRELTKKELELISMQSELPLEIFVHGALCYSFSGQCQFSSYLNGNSANRGLCSQICRRNFISETSKSTLFSLKDFQLIEEIPFFAKLKISSLKIEGRMKNAEYVYNSARAYRMVIDDHTKIEQAKDILKYDFAREKTSWFMGTKINQAYTDKAGTGIFAGKILKTNNNQFEIEKNIKLEKFWQLRLRNQADTEANLMSILNISETQNRYIISVDNSKFSLGDEVYLSGKNSFASKNFKLPNINIKINSFTQKQCKTLIDKILKPSSKQNKQELFIRISNFEYIEKIKTQDFQAIFLKLKFSDLKKLGEQKIDSKIISKIRIELPFYISELRINETKQTLQQLFNKGFKHFIISHISQFALLPKHSKVSSSESIYLLNDLAIFFLKNYNIEDYCYPFENDYPNLLTGKDREGIVPIYFRPALFYSRMPIKSGILIKDEQSRNYYKNIENGFTVIRDSSAVSLTQNISKLKSKGFNKFLIDISNNEDIIKLGEIIDFLNSSTKISGTRDYNFKKELH